jgi:alpha-D-xyloside xylohydrolase
VFDFAGDAASLDQTQAYTFGKAFLVTPVTEAGVSTWPCYLPPTQGGWLDFWTDARREGGRTHRVEAALARVPLHVRAGSILPLRPVVQSTTEATGEHLELHVFPGADGSYELYEDSGLDYGYAQGEYAVIPMRWRERDKTLELAARRGSFPGMSEERRFTVVLRGQEGESVRREIAYAGRRAVIRC